MHQPGKFENNTMQMVYGWALVMQVTLAVLICGVIKTGKIMIRNNFYSALIKETSRLNLCAKWIRMKTKTNFIAILGATCMTVPSSGNRNY